MNSMIIERNNRCGLTMAVMVVVAVICLMTQNLQAAERPPNIVLIVSDDQGYADLGFLDRNEIITPHLDQLAKEGVYCSNFYVTWPACTPSRGSILTGRYPQRNGLYDMIRNDIADFGVLIPPYEYAVSPERILGMDVREVTIAEVLKKAGYATGVYGKWDGGQLLRYLPMQRGFDDYYGFANTGIDYYTHERYGVPSMFRDNQPTIEDRGTYSTDLFRREALKFIDQHQEQPFFLYVPFNAPHGGSNLAPELRGLVQAPKKYRDMYPQYEERYVKGKKYGKPATVPDRETRRLYYLAATTAMDEAIGAILDRLDQLDLTNDTFVIFFSDNGGSSIADNSPLRGHKGQMFEGGIRVPFIARFPGVIPPGSTNDEFLTSLELFPTFTYLAGQKLPKGITYDGFDMLSILAGKEPSPRKEMYWQRRGDRAARFKQWKWVDSKKGSGLFDLSQDIQESNDLSEKHPEVLKLLQGKFAQWKEEMGAAEPRGPFRNY